MRQLKDRVTLAVTHALCDIITEYTLLTAPICLTPRNLLQDLKTLPVTSLPSSPVTVKSESHLVVIFFLHVCYFLFVGTL
jgi:hypothetical protein